MTEAYHAEFRTIDVILASEAPTRGVDAFALAVIKTERQMRRLVTHLIFQSPCLGVSDIAALRDSLWSNRNVYFEGFERGFDALSTRSVRDLVGHEYDRLRSRIDEAIDHRNKIFHGQLTSKFLTREHLVAYVTDLRTWCKELADSASADFGYDGFDRNSFRKSTMPGLVARLRLQGLDLEGYVRFIREHLQRQQAP